jgi:cytochrome P450
VQAEVQFELSAVTIFTTTAMIVAALFELAIRPEVMEDLRAEIRTVLDANNGEMTPSALHQMRLTDSFLRETARVNPQAPARFQRYVEKPLVLKDGTYIPAGVYIEAPAEPILYDANVFPNPEVFDARRFLKLREGTGEDYIGYQNRELYQFVTSTKENLAFGFGPHVCPGRFWATNALKLMLARIISRYDIRMPNGSKEKARLVSAGLHVQPDPTAKIEFKGRTPDGIEANA